MKWFKDKSRDERVIDALAAEKRSHDDLLTVVTELEALVGRLAELPEVRTAKGRKKT